MYFIVLLVSDSISQTDLSEAVQSPSVAGVAQAMMQKEKEVSLMYSGPCVDL